jgi:membrane protein EpsK
MNNNILETHLNLKKQFPLNITANIFYFVLNLGIGIWLVPYLIHHLGVASYGLVPLATSITAYMSLLTISLNGAVSRYLTIDLQKKDNKSANQFFNTAFFGSLGLVLLMLPIAGLISYFVTDIFDVPSGQSGNARLLFFAIMAAFLVTTVNSNFAVSSFAKNRFDLRNGVEGSGLIARVIFIILLFNLFSPHLFYVGLSYLGGSLITLIGAVWVWKKLTPELKVCFANFDRSRLRDLTGMGGWMFINQAAMLLFLNIDLIVVNKLFGADSGGKYASVLQWTILLRSMAATLVGVLTPIILSYYARGQMDQVINVSKKAVKLLGLTMALPIGVVCGFAAPLLSIWIGPQFSEFAPLMWLLVGHLCINLSVLPLFSNQLALNKVKIPGIIALSMGVVNFILAISLPLLFGWGIYGVAAAGAIVLTLKNAIFTPWYGAQILNKPWNTFINSMLPGLIATIAIAIISFGIAHNFNQSSWVDLIISFSIITLAYLLVVFFVVLRCDERELLISFIPAKGGLQRILNKK